MDLPLPDDIPAALEPAAWWGLFGREEHERLDFKRQPGKSLPELLPAMAMTDGGLVVFGIDDGRRIVGASLDQALRDTVADAVHATGMEVRLREVRIGGVPVVVLAVPKLSVLLGLLVLVTACGRSPEGFEEPCDSGLPCPEPLVCLPNWESDLMKFGFDYYYEPRCRVTCTTNRDCVKIPGEPRNYTCVPSDEPDGRLMCAYYEPL